jgi:hypothetical protein
MPTRSAALAGGLLVSLPLLLSSTSAQEPLPWQRERYQQRDDGYRQNSRVPRTEEEEEPATNPPRPQRSLSRPAERSLRTALQCARRPVNDPLCATHPAA